jgi:hypothetical protein
MYHYDAHLALEELSEDAVLPNPTHVRDMMVRCELSPDQAVDLSKKFHTYLHSFGDAQSLAKEILEQLAGASPKR